MSSPGEYKIIRFIYLLSVGLSLVLTVPLIFQNLMPYLLLFLFFLTLLAAGWIALRWTEKRNRPAGFFMTITMLNLLFIAPELLLRDFRFRYESGIQFGHPRPTHFLHFINDEQLFWRLNPEHRGVNSFGFPGKEIEIPKPDSTFRLLYLGDSCTQQGYPEKVENRLNRSGEDTLRFESVPLALSGYTSHQGKIVATRYGLGTDPDAVFIYYGWNDHWLAFGAGDSEKQIRETPKWFSLIMHSRTVQWIFWVQNKLKGREIKPLDTVRVPLDEYRENIQTIISLFQDRGIPVILLTAPSAHRKLGIPDYLIDSHFAKDKPSIIRMHEAYNDVIRSLARENHVPLLDLASRLEAKPAKEIQNLFLSDGIHFTEAGLDTIAGQI